MFTFADYNDRKAVATTIDVQALELDRIGERFASRSYDRFRMHFRDHSEGTLKALAEQALKSGKLPSDTPVITIVNRTVWKLCDGVAKQISMASCHVHQLAIEQGIVSHTYTKEVLSRLNFGIPVLELHSSNIPEIPYPHLYSGANVVSYFRDTIQSIAPHVKELYSAEWRFESLQLHQEEQVEFALQQLTSKGFQVDIQSPYMIVDTDLETGKLSLQSHQSISARIPLEFSINEDAVLQDHRSYKPSLSAHNVLVKWRDTHNKASLQKYSGNSTMTVEEMLEQIAKELDFVADQDPIIKRYACRVDFLDDHKQQTLLEELKARGFTANLDNRFFCRRFSGIFNGFFEHHLRQYILIDLS